MADLRQAAQQALEALHEIAWCNNDSRWQTDRAESVIPALRDALAQQEQEPFGYIWPTGRHPEFRYTKQMRDGVAGMPLYTHPPRREWQSLSEEEVASCWAKGFEACKDQTVGDLLRMHIARAIEAALKEKNNG
jgi:hypothetical protein